MNRWYVNKDGQVRGPFPAGALVQDRLVGRIGDADLLSPDQAEWKTFADWPELAAALSVAAAQPSSQDGEDRWTAERNQARMRWADQRSGEDRRNASGELEGVRAQRRDSDRREDPVETSKRSKRGLPKAPGILGAEVPTWVLLVGLAGLVALVGVLVYVFGAVNPVRVQIR